PCYYGGGPQSGVEGAADPWVGRYAWRSVPGGGAFDTVTHQRGSAVSIPQPDPVHYVCCHSGHAGSSGFDASMADRKNKAGGEKRDPGTRAGAGHSKEDREGLTSFPG